MDGNGQETAVLDIRRVWLEELLSKPHLFPEQVALVQSLAEELGVDVRIVDKRLSWNGGEWQVRGDHG